MVGRCVTLTANIVLNENESNWHLTEKYLNVGIEAYLIILFFDFGGKRLEDKETELPPAFWLLKQPVVELFHLIHDIY